MVVFSYYLPCIIEKMHLSTFVLLFSRKKNLACFRCSLPIIYFPSFRRKNCLPFQEKGSCFPRRADACAACVSPWTAFQRAVICGPAKRPPVLCRMEFGEMRCRDAPLMLLSLDFTKFVFFFSLENKLRNTDIRFSRSFFLLFLPTLPDSSHLFIRLRLRFILAWEKAPPCFFFVQLILAAEITLLTVCSCVAFIYTFRQKKRRRIREWTVDVQPFSLVVQPFFPPN